MLVAIMMMVLPDDLDAQRRGGSFGGRRSYSAPRSAPRSSGRRSFGGTRRSQRREAQRPMQRRYDSRPTTRSNRTPTGTRQQNAFGGTRLNSAKEYTSRYGTPRRTETRTLSGAAGGKN